MSEESSETMVFYDKWTRIIDEQINNGAGEGYVKILVNSDEGRCLASSMSGVLGFKEWDAFTSYFKVKGFYPLITTVHEEDLDDPEMEPWEYHILKMVREVPQVFSLEKIDDGFILYQGRTGLQHGYNLAYIREPAHNFDPEFIERLLNLGLAAHLERVRQGDI